MTDERRPDSAWTPPPTTRRGFLARAAAAGGALALGAAGCEVEENPAAGPAEPAAGEAATLPAGKDPANFVVHSETPLEIAMA